jgi:alcohol dehydrogenase
LQELGADLVIDSTQEEFGKRVWQATGKVGADLVVDYTGKATWPSSIRCTRKGGRIVTCGATTGFEAVTDLRYIWVREIDIIGSNGWERQDLIILLDLVRSGKIKPIIDAELPLEQIREGEALLEERKVFGKVIIQP